jgi:hypothetical protein
MTVFRGSHSKANARPSGGSTTAGGHTLTKQETLLFHEFDQAWDHYRHNETVRSQYLGYFFALSLGSAAFGAQTVRSDALSSAPDQDLVLFGIFLLVFAFLTGFVYLGIRKAGVVLTHYESVWNNIRKYFYSDVDIQSEPYSSLSIRSYNHRALRSRLTRMQSSSEFVVLFFSALTVISQALVSARLFTIHNASWLERMIAIGMAALTAAIPIILIVVKTAQSNTSATS